MSQDNRFAEDFFAKHSYHSIAIKLLQNNQSVDIVLTGHCMKPLLCETDIITVTPIDAENVCCGDVVLYHIDGRLKCHRYLRQALIDGKKYLITKSDRRYHHDPPVPVSDLLGKIVKIRKELKIIDYESIKWSRINFALGKLSPFISKIERPALLLYRIPKRAVCFIKRTVTTL